MPRRRYLDKAAPADVTYNSIRPVYRNIQVKKKDTPQRRENEAAKARARAEQARVTPANPRQASIGPYRQKTAIDKAGGRLYAAAEQRAKDAQDREAAGTVLNALFKPLMPSTYVDMAAAVKNGQVNNVVDALAAPYLSDSWSMRNPGKALAVDLLTPSIKPMGNKFYNLVDRRFVPKNKVLTYNPDHSVMYRYIGTKDSGYKDLLTSGIIRGNPRHGLFNAKELRKRVKQLEKKGFTEDELRDISSNNLSESLFNKIKQVESKSDKFTIGKFRLDRESMLDDYNTYADYIEDMNTRVLQSNNPNVNRVVSPVKSSKMGDVIALQLAHGNNPMATFAYGDETLANRIQFPGDYAISVKNAQSYARDGRPFGHFEQHPVTAYPLEYNNPDVTIYKRRDGLLSGKKYMIEVPRDVVERDRLLYLNNSNYHAYKGPGYSFNVPNVFKYLPNTYPVGAIPFILNNK